MNPVIESLLKIVETDPIPDVHISSFWRGYGRETIVERRGDDLTLRAAGFDTIHRMGIRARALHAVERLSYRSVTFQSKSYSRIWRVARHLAHDLQGGPNFYVFKSACALAVLADHWTVHGLSPKTFAVIGDGYGFLGALIRRYLGDVRLYCVDLPKMLVFQSRTHEMSDPEVTMRVLSINETDRQTDRQTLRWFYRRTPKVSPTRSTVRSTSSACRR